MTVVDLSQVALDEVRARLGSAPGLTCVRTDILEWEPSRRYGLWHDRALFHFLTKPADRERYLSVMRQALEPGGAFVVGTFGANGPTSCSGLPVKRYSTDELSAALGDVAVSIAELDVHTTPAGADQHFSWIAGVLEPARK